MKLTKKFFSPLPENESSVPKEGINEDAVPASEDRITEGVDLTDDAKIKSNKTTLRDALQEWSNDDARDTAEDDSTPLRSGL